MFKITSVVVLVDRFLRYARGSVEDCDKAFARLAHHLATE
ncbi:unnamed protein product [marine sediment metagenome]|uniref:Uncharacterized protein n=1 Tax=marine sediment metagenome TaxID=412755 RepID=X1TI85_9ZZZZ